MNEQAKNRLCLLDGLPLVPVTAATGTKKPLGGNDWDKHPKTAAQVAAMNGNVDMVGLLLNDRFTAVDVDGPQIPKWVDETYDIDLKLLPKTWTVSSTRPGRLCEIYRAPSPQQRARLNEAGIELGNVAIKTMLPIPDPENDASGAADKTQGLEIRFRGQQVVLGRHPSPRGLHYDWLMGAPSEVAPLPDLVIDLLIAHHKATAEAKAKKRGSRAKKKVAPVGPANTKKFVQGLPEVTEPHWWEWSGEERLTRLAEKWLKPEEGNGYENWMHICSLMKATIEQNGMDPTTAVEAFLTFSQRAPGFVSDEDCLNKFEAMDEGTFEDPLGLLVCKGQDGGLVLPLKPKTAQGGTTEPNSAQVGIERVEEELRRALDQNAGPEALAVLTAELASMSKFSQAAINSIAKTMAAADQAEEDRKARAEALAATAAIEQEFCALKLEEFLPPEVAEPIRVTAEGMPYPEHSLLFTFLLGACSVLPQGLKVCMNRRTRFTVPLNLYLAEVGESGRKKTPKTQRLLKMPTTDVKGVLAAQFEREMSDWIAKPVKKRGPKPKPLFIQMDGFTGEVLCEKLQMAYSRQKSLLVYREELRAVFDGLGIYKAAAGKGSGGEEELILELYDGHEHIQCRVGGDRYFATSQVSIGGCIQQGVLVDLIGAKDDANGKWARFLFIPMPDGAVVPLPDDTDEVAVERADRADRKLRELINGLSLIRPATLQCTQEAKRWFADFEEGQQRKVRQESAVSMRSLLNKSAGKVARLAGLLKVMEGARPWVDLEDPEAMATQASGGFDVKGEVELRHVKAAARLVELSDRWTMSFNDAAAAGGEGETVAAVVALETRLQEIAVKLGDWVTWKRIRLNLTPTQRREVSAERGKQLLRQMAEKGMGEFELGDRGGAKYRAK